MAVETVRREPVSAGRMPKTGNFGHFSPFSAPSTARKGRELGLGAKNSLTNRSGNFSLRTASALGRTGYSFAVTGYLGYPCRTGLARRRHHRRLTKSRPSVATPTGAIDQTLLDLTLFAIAALKLEADPKSWVETQSSLADSQSASRFPLPQSVTSDGVATHAIVEVTVCTDQRIGPRRVRQRARRIAINGRITRQD